MTVRSLTTRRGARLGLGLSSVLLLGGCATYSPDGGLSIARETASRELRQDTVRIRNAADLGSGLISPEPKSL